MLESNSDEQFITIENESGSLERLLKQDLLEKKIFCQRA